MNKNDKKRVVGPSARIGGTEKARGVAVENKIGKGKPPEAHKWKPGHSGNPSGLPSAHREVIIDAVKAMLAEVDPKLKKNLFERLLEQCARRALQGSKWHMGVLLDYGLGKPRQSVEMKNTFSYHDVLARVRAKLDEPGRELPRSPAVTTNGHRDVQTAQAAREDDASESAPSLIEQRPAQIRVEL